MSEFPSARNGERRLHNMLSVLQPYNRPDPPRAVGPCSTFPFVNTHRPTITVVTFKNTFLTFKLLFGFLSAKGFPGSH